MSNVLIELSDGRVVTPAEHYLMLCKKFELRIGAQIKRDPNNRERWIEDERCNSPATAGAVRPMLEGYK